MLEQATQLSDNEHVHKTHWHCMEKPTNQRQAIETTTGHVFTIYLVV